MRGIRSRSGSEEKNGFDVSGGFVWGGLGKKIAEKSEVCCGGLNR